jgi:DNA-binding NtrC family response regulator
MLIQFQILAPQNSAPPPPPPPPTPQVVKQITIDPEGGLHAFTDACERVYILTVLRAFHGRKVDAAQAMKISRKCLWQKCRLFGITDAEIFKTEVPTAS